ncbi:MAG: phosphatase PAP2 family protein [Ilumatobacteraceae bacterium]
MTSLDAAGDRILEPLRNNRSSIRLFNLASKVGDFSIVWHLCGVLYAIGSLDRAKEALALSVALGIESLIVNQGIKRLFRRERPTTSGDHRFDVRTPSTTSFPSGHASSATFAAALLTSYTGLPLALLWASIAIVVALSRVVVRIHHLSDILGGIVTGAALSVPAIIVLSALFS